MTAWALVLAATTAWAAPAPPVAVPAVGDTTVALSRGDRVVVEGLSGRLTVEGGEGGVLRLTTERGGDEVVVHRDGDSVRITPAGRVGRRPTDVVLHLPRWASVQVGGVNLDVEVMDMAADVTIETITGDVRVSRSEARLVVSTVEGSVDVLDPRGSVQVSAHTDDIVISGPRGDVEAVSLDGDITITGSSASNVRAETQSGDIDYSGSIRVGGRYAFYLHSGDARLVLPTDLNARIRASTFHGDFESDFPVMVSDFSSGRAFDFTVGDGGAAIEVEVFDGEIRLSREP
jgi:hypothetical protein